jgi:hypothetical protein
MTAAARARRLDPITSHLAAAQMELSGIARDHRDLIEALIGAHPGSTSAELARHSRGALDRWQVARRLKEIEANGRICRSAEKKCDVTHRQCVTWIPNTPPLAA